MVTQFETAQILPAFPDHAQFDMDLTLGARKWTFVFTWRERLGHWYADVYDDNRDAVVRGRMVTPLSNIVGGVLDFPGSLIAFGDESARQNLGRQMQVVYMVPE